MFIFLIIGIICLIISIIILIYSYKLNKKTLLILNGNISPENMQEIFDFYVSDKI